MADTPQPQAPASQVGTPSTLRLLLVDAPNIDFALGSLLGRKPNPEERLRFDRLAEWFAARARPGETAEACYFINVLPDRAGEVRSWVHALRENGFWVFAKPKVGDSDIDQDMVDHIARRRHEGKIQEVIVASADQDNFRGALIELSQAGTDVAVLGFAERAVWALGVPGITFIDLEEIGGLFTSAIPREPILERLPPEGAWFRPLHPLGRGRVTTQVP